eukprot:4029466-Prymnesium_polylepis.1
MTWQFPWPRVVPLGHLKAKQNGVAIPVAPRGPSGWATFPPPMQAEVASDSEPASRGQKGEGRIHDGTQIG